MEAFEPGGWKMYENMSWTYLYITTINVVFPSITNMATMRNFHIISDKLNVYVVSAQVTGFSVLIK